MHGLHDGTENVFLFIQGKNDTSTFSAQLSKQSSFLKYLSVYEEWYKDSTMVFIKGKKTLSVDMVLMQNNLCL